MYMYIHISRLTYIYICSFEGLLAIVLGIALDFRYSMRNVKPFCRQDVFFSCCTGYAKVFKVTKFIATKE